ncbi:hypothetical protein BH11PSE12_BH11PSE12_04640 [soil metagenome]
MHFQSDDYLTENAFAKFNLPDAPVVQARSRENAWQDIVYVIIVCPRHQLLDFFSLSGITPTARCCRRRDAFLCAYLSRIDYSPSRLSLATADGVKVISTSPRSGIPA